MQLILTVLHLMLAIGLVGLILIQHGRGADAGAAFGSGASSTVFGAQGSGSFLSRSTAVIATLFFLTSMTLAYFAAQVGEPRGLMDDVEVPAPSGIDSSGTPSPDLLPGDLPPSPATELRPSGAGVSVDDMPTVDAPMSPPPSTDPADDARPPAPATPDAAESAPGDSTGSGE